MRAAPKARQPKFPMMIDLTGHEDGNSQGILATLLGYDRLLGFLATYKPTTPIANFKQDAIIKTKGNGARYMPHPVFKQGKMTGPIMGFAENSGHYQQTSKSVFPYFTVGVVRRNYRC